MPRTVDLSQAPPPQAVCYVCERTVTLAPQARRVGKFRCPFCRTDNKVDASGLGVPLSGAVERLEDMPQTRCTRCGATNRLPRRILKRGGYTCFACGAVEQVPRTLRRRAGVVPEASTIIVTVICLALIWFSGWSIRRVGRSFGLWTGDRGPTAVYDNQEPLALAGARPLAATVAGRRYEVTVRVFNYLDREATFYVRAQVLYGERLTASRTVAVRDLASGKVRTVPIVIVDPRRGAADSVKIELVGVG